MQQTQSEITYIVAYRCPNCQVALEARTSEANTWLCCPKCGRASLPPELMRPPRVAHLAPDDAVLVIGPDQDSDAPEASRAHPGAIRRVLLTVGLLAALMMLAMAFLEGNFVNVAIFGVVAIIVVVIMGFTSRRR
ncbi:hypothetical protein [Singulisphaera acidiphila]|uniref:Uncharacterized protein n=1 Tax=Singulisphaera acidiphila (strain ATCC BAA-1392 / DSM 18658 / VKM B-2454 / MOB10) TaxID=886293 RepID=L0D7C1_SINAD|nr:hypothetical protein [Singulisphaera acidiphila]AGA25142.1 hypothetical protein Sinac_0732 [Singulisphaera acidiphila DSM 18658]